MAFSQPGEADRAVEIVAQNGVDERAPQADARRSCRPRPWRTSRTSPRTGRSAGRPERDRRPPILIVSWAKRPILLSSRWSVMVVSCRGGDVEPDEPPADLLARGRGDGLPVGVGAAGGVIVDEVVGLPGRGRRERRFVLAARDELVEHAEKAVLEAGHGRAGPHAAGRFPVVQRAAAPAVARDDVEVLGLGAGRVVEEERLLVLRVSDREVDPRALVDDVRPADPGQEGALRRRACGSTPRAGACRRPARRRARGGRSKPNSRTPLNLSRTFIDSLNIPERSRRL